MSENFDPDKYLAETPSEESTFDPDAYLAESAPVTEEIQDSKIDPIEALKMLGGGAAGGAAGYATGEAFSPAVEAGAKLISEKALDPAAEILAYRGAGGFSGTKAGKELNSAMIDKNAGNLSKGIEELAESGVFDDGVTPKSVGRTVLDKKLLGPAGLGLKTSNAKKAKANLFQTSKPTNEILNSIEEYPVSQSGIFNRMKEILGYEELNPTLPDEVSVKDKLDKLNEKSFNDLETPLKAEKAKRKLHKRADFSDPEKTVKNAMNTAQATARKEAVEQAVENALGPEKLAEFKRLKAQSGSAGVASDMLLDLYEKSQKPFSGFNSITGTGIDFLKQRGAGIVGSALDTGSKILKKGAKKAPGALGALAGLTVGAMAADDQTDSADFIPGLDQATAAGSAQDDKLIKAESKAFQNYNKSPAAQDRADYLRNSLESAPESIKGGLAYKQAQDELNSITGKSKALNKSSPEELIQLSDSFKNIKGADKFVAPLEQAAQSSSDEEKQARLFGLYQQPAFRQLLKKS